MGRSSHSPLSSRSHDVFSKGEPGDSALCVPCEELSHLEVVYFFCCCCPHIKMKGLNQEVRRTRLVIPLKTRPGDWGRRGVGGGVAHALVCFCCTYLSCLMSTQDVAYRCKRASFRVTCAVIVHSQVDSWAIKDHPLHQHFFSLFFLSEDF